ncbi:AraC family transcriptional regulator [Massilia sp. W12]|uniref:AraC family transcriptional regulator n=1 Tax=Massilia sp. W12 TaxID=3126507 RepID=UPI0030CAE09C
MMDADGLSRANLQLPPLLQRMQAVIEHIEAHLHEALPMAELAVVSGLSQWHFQRVFHACLGETVKTYIRQRRLSQAAHSLLHSRRSVLEIALCAGFDSNEAFTRAFRAWAGCTPRAWRQGQGVTEQALLPRFKAQIGQDYLQHLNENLQLEPDLRYQPAQQIVGFTRRLQLQGAGVDLLAMLAPCWREWRSRLEEIPHRSDTRVCLILELLAMSDTACQLQVWLGAPVNALGRLPSGMACVDRPAGWQAVFQHKGAGPAWEYTMQYIFGAWLPRSNCQLAPVPGLCLFAPEQAPFEAAPVLEYCLPLLSSSS